MKSKNFFCIILLMFISVSIFGETRNALLIANGKYAKLAKLDNPIPEAIALKESLLELGFEVTLISNATLENMKIEMKKFRDKIKNEKGIAFFHYGGHAVQVGDENYLLPIDADIPAEEYVSTRAYPIKELMFSMVGETNIVILDSCRNNPLSGSSRSATRGLQMVSVKPRNSVVVYSARAGQVAEDGVFTPVFTRKILENKSFSDVLIDVRNEVSKRTNGKQIPGEYSEMTKPIYLANVPEKQRRQQEELARIQRENEIKHHELDILKTTTTNNENSLIENNVSITNVVKSKSVVKPATVKDNLKSHKSLNISFIISCMIGIIISSGLIYVFYILWVMYNH